MPRYAEAIHLFSAALAVHPTAYTCYFRRAECYERLGQLEDAEAECTALLDKKLDPDYRYTLAALLGMASLCERIGKLDKAERLYRRALQHEHNKNQPNAADVAEARGQFGMFLFQQQRYADAEPLLREYWALREKVLAHDWRVWRTFHVQSMLGATFLGLKRYAEAEPLLLGGFKGLRACQAMMPRAEYQTCISEALDRVSRLYDAWPNPDAAQRWRAELKDFEKGFVRSWLVLSEPLQYSEDGAKALDLEQIPREAFLRPRTGDRVQADRNTLVWKEHHARDLYIDFEVVYGLHCPFNDPKLTYAVCYIHADTDRTDLALLVGSDDQAKIYLNGREVYRQLKARGLVLDEDEVKPITLRKGTNVLIFKIVDVGGGWGGSIHVVRSDGSPAQGIRFGLEPD